MFSELICDLVSDYLLILQNFVFIIIDYQLVQVNFIVLMDCQLLVNNIVGIVKVVVVYGLLIVYLMVNVKIGLNKLLILQLCKVLGDYFIYDCIIINFWEDVEFCKVVEVIGCCKLIMIVLWIEVCLIFLVLDVLKEGFEVYVVVDVVGGILLVVYDVVLCCIEQVGGQLISVLQLFCELQCDWVCLVMVLVFMNFFIEIGGIVGIQFLYDCIE